MRTVTYLSFTGWKTMNACPEAYDHRYVHKKPVVDAEQVNFVKGNALHHLLEAYMLRGESDPNWMIEEAPLFWARELSNIFQNPQQKLTWKAGGEKLQRETFLGWAFELAKLLKTHNITPERVQPEFKADTRVTLGNHRLILGGRIDLLVKAKTGYMILDLKSSVHQRVVTPDQVLWYAMLTDLFLGDQLESPVAHGGFLLPGFPEGKKIQIFETPPEAKEDLKRRITRTLDQIAAENFPAKPGRDCWTCDFRPWCSQYGGMTPHESGIVQLGID